ncbi:hypothetical protein ACFL58_03285, partial [Elusimicrobiota bacterium]
VDNGNILELLLFLSFVSRNDELNKDNIVDINSQLENIERETQNIINGYGLKNSQDIVMPGLISRYIPVLELIYGIQSKNTNELIREIKYNFNPVISALSRNGLLSEGYQYDGEIWGGTASLLSIASVGGLVMKLAQLEEPEFKVEEIINTSAEPAIKQIKEIFRAA